MKIVGWIKSRVRRWLLEEDGTNMSLDCLVKVPMTNGQTERIAFIITGSHGLFLVGTGQTGSVLQQRLLPMHVAVDPERWWAIWRKLNPKAKVTWEEDS